MDSVRQCPCCPIRFAHRTELAWHLQEEHPEARFDYVTRSERARAAAGIPEPRRPMSVPVPR